MKMFQGKFAVVTGGTRGIGRAISFALAEQGAHVLALYARDRESAAALEKDAAAEGLNVTTIRGDLTDEESFKKSVEQIRTLAPSLDLLVHSAASGVHRPALEISPKHLRWTFEINVFAFHALVRELAPSMKPGSRIVGVTSSGGTRVIPYYAAVGASKGALEALLRHYAAELAPKGIAVNALCPGLVLTDAVDAFPDREKRVQAALSATPTGHLTTAQDVAAACVFLCSTAASQMIGQTLVLDGGKTLWS